MKVCLKCGNEKKLKNDGKFYCPTCINSLNRRKYAEDPAARRANSKKQNRNPEAAWWSRVLCIYGMSKENYLQMFEAQGGACKLCGKPEKSLGRTGRVKRLAVDHCHATGKIRGLLCHLCNVALGAFEDNPVVLERATKYVRGEL